ncbi:hypothetical protein AURDEDRAFT_166916 [Auricularia subglabra TFB-10046 SS5]|nr:hypothetical protein AURDEDRAFT_166916 [Auricularia subglabra TFB-10046 SS5]
MSQDMPMLSIPLPLGDIALLTLRPAKLFRLIAWELLQCTGHIIREDNSCELEWEAPCRSLRPGVDVFVIGAGQSHGNLLNTSDIFTRAGGSRYSTEGSELAFSDQLPAVARREYVARRDGGSCIFAAFGDVAEVRILSTQAGFDADYISALAASRGFGFKSSKDPQNTLAMVEAMWDECDRQESFILAERRAPANVSYIWQTLPRFHKPKSMVRKGVAHNQRARFADPDVEHMPSPSAINYVYVGALLKRYLPETELITNPHTRNMAFSEPPSGLAPGSLDALVSPLELMHIVRQQVVTADEQTVQALKEECMDDWFSTVY